MKNERVKRIVTTTNILKDKPVKLYGIPEDEIDVIPYGVNLELFRPTKLPDEDTALYYGTLALHRSRFLVKVIEEVLKRRKDVRFIPVVGTDVDESWPIRESGAGIISPLDPAAFAEAVVKLLEDEELAERLAERGIRYARQYDWKDMVKRYVQLMKEVACS